MQDVVCGVRCMTARWSVFVPFRGPDGRLAKADWSSALYPLLQWESHYGDANAFIIAWLGTDGNSVLTSVTLSELIGWLRKCMLPALHQMLTDFEVHRVSVCVWCV